MPANVLALGGVGEIGEEYFLFYVNVFDYVNSTKTPISYKRLLPAGFILLFC